MTRDRADRQTEEWCRDLRVDALVRLHVPVAEVEERLPPDEAPRRKCVHVQAAIGIEDPVEETRWLQEQADRTGFRHGIVAHCDLTLPNAPETIEQHMACANMRGVRDFGQGDYLVNPVWQQGYGLPGPLGLVFCLDLVPENLDKARARRALPGRRPVQRPCRLPTLPEPEYFEM